MRSDIHLAGNIQIIVGTLFTTQFACGPIFRKITWASLDQKGLGLATKGAEARYR